MSGDINYRYNLPRHLHTCLGRLFQTVD